MNKPFWQVNWNGDQQSIGRYYPGLQGSGEALRRGGDWQDGNGAGVFSALADRAPNSRAADVGFRCVKSLSLIAQ